MPISRPSRVATQNFHLFFLGGADQAGRLREGGLGPADRVLEPGREVQTQLLRDQPLPEAQEHLVRQGGVENAA